LVNNISPGKDIKQIAVNYLINLGYFQLLGLKFPRCESRQIKIVNEFSILVFENNKGLPIEVTADFSLK
jgi:hypothetical protein